MAGFARCPLFSTGRLKRSLKKAAEKTFASTEERDIYRCLHGHKNARQLPQGDISHTIATPCHFMHKIFSIMLILLTRQKPDPTLGRTSCQGQVPCKAKFVLRLSSVTLCGLCQYRSKHPWFDCGCSILRLGPRNDSLTEVLHLQMWRLWRTEGRQLSPQAEA